MTVYAKCVQAGDDFDAIEWHPWINCKPQDDPEILRRMILYRWLRNRGGVAWGERLSVTVYTYDDSTPCYANGKPTCCRSTTFDITRDAEGVAV